MLHNLDTICKSCLLKLRSESTRVQSSHRRVARRPGPVFDFGDVAESGLTHPVANRAVLQRSPGFESQRLR